MSLTSTLVGSFTCVHVPLEEFEGCIVIYISLRIQWSRYRELPSSAGGVASNYFNRVKNTWYDSLYYVLISIDCAMRLAVTQEECTRLYYSSIGSSFSAQFALSSASFCRYWAVKLLNCIVLEHCVLFLLFIKPCRLWLLLFITLGQLAFIVR